MTSIALAPMHESEGSRAVLSPAFAAPFAVLRPLRGTHELLAVRQEIAAGTYDTPEKFELALDKMLGELDLG